MKTIPLVASIVPFQVLVWSLIKWVLTPATVLLLFTAQPATGQIAAPEFKCVDGDTLVWEIPTIDCGDLLGYVIYRANEINGPYEVLDSVFSPATTTVEAPNPFGLTWYYYLSSLTNCPEEEELLNSDTLSNLPLSKVPITSLSVVDDGVLVEWNESSNVEISQYVIYRNTSDGTVPIDTVADTLQYLDMAVEATNRSEIYYVLAMNDCGTKSFFDEPHNTILLDYEVEECAQAIHLNWNAYVNWPDGRSGHILWVGSPEDSFYQSMDIPANEFSVSFDSLVKDQEICFYITAENQSLNASSKSNTICLVPDIVEPVRDLFVTDLCTDHENNTVDLRWYWNETAEIERFRIMMRGRGQTEFNAIHTESITPPIQPLNSISLQIPAGTSPPYEIYLETTDRCDSTVISDIAIPLFLEGKNRSETTNRLNWSFTAAEETYPEQNLEKELVDGTTREFDLTGQTSGEFDDQINAGDLNEGRICYRKNISGTVSLPNGETTSFNCTSNEVCLTGEVRVYIPNAFKPEGVNTVFKPEFLFRDNIAEYQLLIFDRWGQKIFESRNPDFGWNGRIDGELPDQGEFTYTLDFTADDGSRFRESGGVLLVR